MASSPETWPPAVLKPNLSVNPIQGPGSPLVSSPPQKLPSFLKATRLMSFHVFLVHTKEL